MALTAPLTVLVGDNDFSAVITVVGIDPFTGVEARYHGTQVKAFWSDAKDSDVALGSVTVDCPEIGQSGEFAVLMEASQVTTALGGKADGAIVYLIGRAQGDWRRYRECVVRKAGAFL